MHLSARAEAGELNKEDDRTGSQLVCGAVFFLWVSTFGPHLPLPSLVSAQEEAKLQGHVGQPGSSSETRIKKKEGKKHGAKQVMEQKCAAFENDPSIHQKLTAMLSLTAAAAAHVKPSTVPTSRGE